MRIAAAGLAVLFTIVPSLAGFNGQTARAAELAYVAGWATLGSVTPAAGCTLDASVEVRRDGEILPNVEVAVDLARDGEVVSYDAGVTGSDGVAYLGLDTSWAAPGYEAWFDVTVGGTYAGGMPLSITEDGGCADNPSIVEIGAEIPVADASDTMLGWSAMPSPGADMVDVGVPTYTQQRNLSCEYASLVIAMGAYGTWVSEYDFDELVGWSSNPHLGYRGDISGYWGNTDDYGVYADPLVPALNHYGFWGEEFYAQGDSNALTARLDAGTPVIVWLGLWGNTAYYDYDDNGAPFKLVPGLHVVVAYGYDSSGVYVSDPAHGSQRFFDWGTFMTYWDVMDGMGLSVGPY